MGLSLRCKLRLVLELSVVSEGVFIVSIVGACARL